jgi:hypothetical protein
MSDSTIQKIHNKHINDPLRVRRDIPDLDPLPIYVHVDSLTIEKANEYLTFSKYTFSLYETYKQSNHVTIFKGLLSATVKLGVVDRFYPNLVDRELYQSIYKAMNDISSLYLQEKNDNHTC